jgi:hypothetical protein
LADNQANEIEQLVNILETDPQQFILYWRFDTAPFVNIQQAAVDLLSEMLSEEQVNKEEMRKVLQAMQNRNQVFNLYLAAANEFIRRKAKNDSDEDK